MDKEQLRAYETCKSWLESNHMANGTQSKLAIVLTNTEATQGPANNPGEERKEEFGVGSGSNSNRQDLAIGSSSRYLLSSSHDEPTSEFELLWRLRKYLVLLGVLAVSVTYNAGLTPPGGFWAVNRDSHHAGDPVLRAGFSQRYEIFFYCNATAFAASLVLIILLLSKSVTRQKIWLHSMQLTMTLDLFSLLGAYAAGSCRSPKSSIYIWVLVFAVFLYVGIHTLVSTRVIPETLTKKLQAMLNEILARRGVPDQQHMSSHQEKDVEEARKLILMLVTFAATITYQAGLSPPGGFWAENESTQRPATSVLRSNYLQRYNFFVSCNDTSFVASLVTIILLLSPKWSSHGIRSRAVSVCVVADLLGLIGAYAAGCCRTVATSLYVMLLAVMVWIFFALLVGAFVCKPIAGWLKRIKSDTLKCMHKVGRAFSLEFGSNRSRNAEQESSYASHQQIARHVTDTPEEGNAFETEHQIPHMKENELHCVHHPEDKQQTKNTAEAVSSSDHPLINDQQSANTEDVMTRHHSMKCHQDISTQSSMSSTDSHPAENQKVAKNKEQSSRTNDLKTTYTVDDLANCGDQSADNQQVGNTNGQSFSTDELNIAVIEVNDLSEQIMTDNDCNGATNDLRVQKEHFDVPNGASEIEMPETNDNSIPCQNGNADNNEVTPSEDMNREYGHLRKSRTYLLLLAILAVSLTYQSGLNPPGGFWSRSEDNHLAGDPILEDTHHRRYIAFFYLNAIAFIASLIMIIMLLNKRMSNKFTKRFALQTAMVVDLLALTGAYVMGTSRETRNSIYISLLVCLVLAYVALHVLIATHVIPEGWKAVVAEKLEHFFSCTHVLPQSTENQTGDVNGKEWERRRNLLLILAVLSATVTYQAGMNPPGNVWSDDPKVSGVPGNPILHHNHSKRYDVFYYSNSVSFVSSVVITILLVNKESCEHGIKSYALRVCLMVGLVGLLIAYAAGSCRKAEESIYLIIIAVAVLISLVIQVLLSSTHDTVGGPLSQFMEGMLKWLFHMKEAREVTISDQRESSDRDEKRVRKRHKYLMLLAILAASVTYQAGMNPPGGFWYDDRDHVSGNPVLHDIHPWRYRTFFCFNDISFMSSIVVIMVLLKRSVRDKDVPLEVLHLIMILDLLALMTAFAAGSCRKFRTSVYVYALVVAVVVYLVLAICVSSGIAKYMRPRQRNEHPSPGNSESDSRSNTLAVPEQV